jgi:SPP1 family predicted phage head-tail adaptor
MSIGSLDRRLVIEREELAADGAGGFSASWVELATVWGRLEPLGGRERLHGLQLESAVSHRVTLRRRDDVTAAMRLSCEGRVFNIRAVLRGGARQPLMALLCEEGVAT